MYSFVSMITMVVPAASTGFHYRSEVKFWIAEVKLQIVEVKLLIAEVKLLITVGQVMDQRRSSYGSLEVKLRIT